MALFLHTKMKGRDWYHAQRLRCANLAVSLFSNPKNPAKSLCRNTICKDFYLMYNKNNVDCYAI